MVHIYRRQGQDRLLTGEIKTAGKDQSWRAKKLGNAVQYVIDITMLEAIMVRLV